MFGYVLPHTAELRVREWHAYRAYYCGLCKELQREYGFLPRMLLNYDLVLPALLADGTAHTAAPTAPERCIASPIERRPVCGRSDGLALAADALVLTAYYKLCDDCADERFLKRRAAGALRLLLHRKAAKAAARRPALDAAMREQTAAQQGGAQVAQGEVLVEQQQVVAEVQIGFTRVGGGEAPSAERKSQSADEAADPTARMTQAIFAEAVPNSRAAARMGLFIGKIVYYLDAAEDFAADTRRGAYNVFALQGLSRAEAVAEAQRLCRMCAGETALAYNLLDTGPCRSILDNIVFLGLPQSIALAGEKRAGPRRGTV